MMQCQEELLRKKNSIISNLRLTEKSLLDEVNANPKLWDRERFKFNLSSQKTLVLKADLAIQDLPDRYAQSIIQFAKQLEAEERAIEETRRQMELSDKQNSCGSTDTGKNTNSSKKV